MKGFFKFLGIFITAVAAIIGILVIVDKVMNKNRIKGDYLDCDGLKNSAKKKSKRILKRADEDLFAR